ncbi:sigma-70 family RNA polymerase sigma factor [Kolteria novifilia]|uniref:sigma-70 family RNA polymerase sigma factor n=1 Tax=Kolteria novifilia TaxID=2527975 RepID=UPI003AF37755
MSTHQELMRDANVTADFGPSDRFMDLVTRHQHQLYGFIFALVHNSADADDLYQQVLIVLWKKFDSLPPEGDFLRWAWQAARYEVLNFWRRKERRPSHVGLSEDLVEDIVERESRQAEADRGLERRRALNECVKRLPEKDRELLETCYTTDLQIKQIAEKIGRSSQSICNSLRRIRSALFECIHRRLSTEGLS